MKKVLYILLFVFICTSCVERVPEGEVKPIPNINNSGQIKVLESVSYISTDLKNTVDLVQVLDKKYIIVTSISRFSSSVVEMRIEQVPDN